MNTDKLKIDNNTKENNIKNKKNNITIKKTTNKKYTRSQLKKKFGYIPNNISKKLISLDNDRIEEKVNHIRVHNLNIKEIHSKNNTLTKLCHDCSNCIKTLNHCMVFVTTCSLLNSNKCSFKTKMDD